MSGRAPARSPRVRLPVVRAECEGPGLCLKLSCRYNLTLEVTEAGAIRLHAERLGLGPPRVWPAPTTPGRQRHRYPHWIDGSEEAFVTELVAWVLTLETNCALDVAELGGLSLEEVGERLGLTREAVRKIERSALAKLRNHPDPAARRLLRELADAAGKSTSDAESSEDESL